MCTTQAKREQLILGSGDSKVRVFKLYSSDCVLTAYGTRECRNYVSSMSTMWPCAGFYMPVTAGFPGVLLSTSFRFVPNTRSGRPRLVPVG